MKIERLGSEGFGRKPLREMYGASSRGAVKEGSEDIWTGGPGKSPPTIAAWKGIEDAGKEGTYKVKLEEDAKTVLEGTLGGIGRFWSNKARRGPQRYRLKGAIARGNRISGESLPMAGRRNNEKERRIGGGGGGGGGGGFGGGGGGGGGWGTRVSDEKHEREVGETFGGGQAEYRDGQFSRCLSGLGGTTPPWKRALETYKKEAKSE